MSNMTVDLQHYLEIQHIVDVFENLSAFQRTLLYMRYVGLIWSLLLFGHLYD